MTQHKRTSLSTQPLEHHGAAGHVLAIQAEAMQCQSQVVLCPRGDGTRKQAVERCA